MPYAKRNTLILLVVLLLIVSGGYGWLKLVMEPEIERLEESTFELSGIYEEMAATAAMFPVLESALQSAASFVESYDKALFPTGLPDQIYRYLSELNFEGNPVEFNYIYNETVRSEGYGIVRSTVNGSGSWRAIYELINRIENSRPVQKVSELQISPINQPGEYGNANFQFVLRSYFAAAPAETVAWADLSRVLAAPERFHNPFYPLIREVEPNEDDLTDVERSLLVGLNRSRVYLRNQNSELVRLSEGDRVWLGRLQRIDVTRREAVFLLNRGGIVEELILEVER